MPLSISRRVYIKWLDASGNGTASEPTSTIVLTDPSSGVYVDLRIRASALQDFPCQPTDHPPAPLDLAPTDVEWAFTGISKSIPLDKDRLPFTRRATFTHEIDSRDAGQDEGDMRPADDGTGDEIEVGQMANPETGVMQRYEERWAEDEILEVPGVLEGEQGGERPPGRILFAESDVPGEGGRIFWLGRYVQSVMKRDAKLYVERWVWVETQQAASGGPRGYWNVARLGEAGVLPGPELILKSTDFTHSGIKWTMKSPVKW